MKFRWIVVGAGAVLFVGAWLAVALVVVMKLSAATFSMTVVAAAFATELLFWCLAFALGTSVIEARRRIWQKISGVFRRSSRGDQRQ